MTTDYRSRLQASLGAAYTLERELGGGGMSSVYLAEETSLGRKVVVKVLPPDLVAGVSVDRFKREIQLAARLQQAQIVPVLTAGEVDGIPYYTMPFVDGESLRARLARVGALPIHEVISILRDVTRALGYAHERGVVHRDIKPDNVLLSGGTAVVTDFGIAKAISDARATSTTGTALTQLGTSIGTPAYISPEQAAGDPDVDHRADLYSFGCMAYELLTGQAPFAGRSPQRTLAAHLTEMPAPVESRRPDVPAPLAALVMRCLEKEPAARPQSAAEIATALEASSSSAALAAQTGTFAGPGGVRRALVAYAIVVAIAALVAKAAVVSLGLPDWVFTGAVLTAALGLPVVLATAYAQHTAVNVSSSTTLTSSTSASQPSGVEALAVRASRHLTWRRTFRAGIFALGAFALVVVGIMVMRTFGIGPVASLMAAGTLNDRERLLVIDFDAGRDTSLSHVVTEAVRTNLGQSNVVSIMPPSAVAGALQYMQRPASTPVDITLAREIAQREGAKAVVTGSIAPLGAGYVMSIRLVSADSGSSLASFQKTVDGPGELLDGIDELTRKLRGRIGESLKTVRDAPALEQVTTGSLEALRRYAEALRASDLEGDYVKAERLLRQAVALDTTFAMAYRKLGITLVNMGMPRAQIDSALTRAYQYRDRLSEKERYLAIASYYSSGPGRNRQAAAEAFERALAIDPNDITALIGLANNLRSRRYFARAESVYTAAARTSRPTQVTLGNLGGTLVNSGKLAAAESVYYELRRQFPNAQAAQTFDPVFMYQRGQLDSVEAFWRRKLTDQNPFIRTSALGSLSSHALLRGQLREARRLRQEALAAAAARGAPQPPFTPGVTDAAVAIWFLGRDEEGVRMLDSVLARNPLNSVPVDDRPYGTVATYYAWAGRADRARAIMAQYDAEVRDTAIRAASAPAVHAINAEILIAENKPLEAVREYWRSDSLPDGPASDCVRCVYSSIGRAYDLANMPDSAIAYWERYIASPSTGSFAQDASWLGGIRKRLGELYEAKGDIQRAASNYLAFIELWKNADPELQPQVAEVRKRLAGLKEISGK